MRSPLNISKNTPSQDGAFGDESNLIEAESVNSDEVTERGERVVKIRGKSLLIATKVCNEKNAQTTRKGPPKIGPV